MTIELTQTQFAHTINVPDEREYNGHTFQVFQDEYTGCPTEWLDSADALCVIGGPHGCMNIPYGQTGTFGLCMILP